MFKRIVMISVVVSVIWLLGLILSVAASLTADQAAPESAAVTQGRTRSEVLQSPPADVLAHAPAASGRHAYIASVEHAISGQAIEVWSHNVDDAPHMLFNRFKVTLSDGSQLEGSTGRDIGPGEWLHVTYPLPHGETGMAVVAFEVELTEAGPFFHYVHDSSFGQHVGI